MKKELFGTIRDNYYRASDGLWSWFNQTNLIIKIMFFVWIVLASSLMKIIGFVFSLGVFLDVISVWIQSKRTIIITAVENMSNNLSIYKVSYIGSPIKAILLSPIAFFFGIIPKWSSTLAVGIHPDLDISTATEYGYFTQLGKAYSKLSLSLFSNLKQHGLFFSPLGLLFALVFGIVIFSISLFFFILIILDYIGWIVSFIRKFVVSSSQAMANQSGKSFMTTIYIPVLLTLFVPLYIALLLIPKIATHEIDSA